MKNHRIRKDLGLVAATLGLVLTAPAWAAEPAETDPVKEEIKAVLRQHDEAMDKQDLKALMALYADDPTIAMMGHRPGRVLEGQSGGGNRLPGVFEGLQGRIVETSCPDTSGGHNGDVAWLVASCNMRDMTPEGKAREYALNVSAVLIKEKEAGSFRPCTFPT